MMTQGTAQSSLLAELKGKLKGAWKEARKVEDYSANAVDPGLYTARWTTGGIQKSKRDGTLYASVRAVISEGPETGKQLSVSQNLKEAGKMTMEMAVGTVLRWFKRMDYQVEDLEIEDMFTIFNELNGIKPLIRIQVKQNGQYMNTDIMGVVVEEGSEPAGEETVEDEAPAEEEESFEEPTEEEEEASTDDEPPFEDEEVLDESDDELPPTRGPARTAPPKKKVAAAPAQAPVKKAAKAAPVPAKKVVKKVARR